ncbi:hypothetical protein PybrP1_001399 [[Pythium] brassicae (nom. inval.)]|nr:hypothetical protein PybrP1_001399 [[Pythium] brassicae (nom. inval.)]
MNADELPQHDQVSPEPVGDDAISQTPPEAAAGDADAVTVGVESAAAEMLEAAPVAELGVSGEDDARMDEGVDDAAPAGAEKEEATSAGGAVGASAECSEAASVESVVAASAEAPAAEAPAAEADADVVMAESEQQPPQEDGVGAGVEEEVSVANVEKNEHENEEYGPSASSYDATAYDPEANLSHAQDEYDPAETSYEQHGSDEYDPANPSSFGSAEYDPENPAYDQEEYDPSSPSYVGASSSPSGADAGPLDSANKRKSLASDAQPSETARDAKRLRSDSHDSSKSPDGRTRRGSDTQGEDKKGLADAAWDRLKDFQTLGEFQINQVSRAAFASVGALPEFAQVSIIARFTRVPLKGVRDKNGQLMRIHHEYLKEHPQVAALQPVSDFVADYTSDPGLFQYGYAPPLPVDGMSSVPVPYQKEGRQRESINDNMTSRLNHLPEHVALVNRVNEKAVSAERANASSAVLGYPGGASGRQGGRPGAYNSRDPAEGYRSGPSGANTAGVGGGYSQQYMSGAITSVDEFSEKCYEVLSELSEGLANEVLTRFLNANLTTVRNRSGFLIGVVKRCRQEYGFN